MRTKPLLRSGLVRTILLASLAASQLTLTGCVPFNPVQAVTGSLVSNQFAELIRQIIAAGGM